jgi:rubrerythrin
MEKSMARQDRIAEWISTASPFEAVSLAIQMERGAVRQYARMAKSAATALLRAKLRYLAEEEREHARLLAGLRRNLHPSATLQPIPRDFMAEATGAPAGGRISDILKLAIKNEVSAEAFYRSCAERAGKAGVRNLFTQLAEREVRHREFLQDELSQQTGTVPWRGLEGALPGEEDFWK